MYELLIFNNIFYKYFIVKNFALSLIITKFKKMEIY